jgi:Rrf2 family protein
VRSPFSRRTDYAIRAAVEIARHDGARVKRHPIATAIDAPSTVVAQALADLVRGGIADAAAGRTGGYVLHRPARDITVADVVSAVEADHDARCVLEERRCVEGAPCALHATLADADDAYTERLARTTLAALAGLDEAPPRPARARRPRPTRAEPAVAMAEPEPTAAGPAPSLGGWLD